jgi:hypothetical protein
MSFTGPSNEITTMVESFNQLITSAQKMDKFFKNNLEESLASEDFENLSEQLFELCCTHNSVRDLLHTFTCTTQDFLDKTLDAMVSIHKREYTLRTDKEREDICFEEDPYEEYLDNSHPNTVRRVKGLPAKKTPPPKRKNMEKEKRRKKAILVSKARHRRNTQPKEADFEDTDTIRIASTVDPSPQEYHTVVGTPCHVCAQPVDNLCISEQPYQVCTKCRQKWDKEYVEVWYTQTNDMLNKAFIDYQKLEDCEYFGTEEEQYYTVLELRNMQDEINGLASSLLFYEILLTPTRPI